MAATIGAAKRTLKHGAWTTSEEMAEVVRAYLYQTSRTTVGGKKEKIWENVKRRVGSGRTEGALKKAFCEWKRDHPVEWDAVQRTAEDDPSGYFKGLVSSGKQFRLIFSQSNPNTRLVRGRQSSRHTPPSRYQPRRCSSHAPWSEATETRSLHDSAY